MGFGFDNIFSLRAYFPLPFSSAPLRFPSNNVHHPAFPPSHHKSPFPAENSDWWHFALVLGFGIFYRWVSGCGGWVLREGGSGGKGE